MGRMSYADKVAEIVADSRGKLTAAEVESWPCCHGCGWPTPPENLSMVKGNQYCEGCNDGADLGPNWFDPCNDFGEPEESFEMEDPADVWRDDCY